MGFKFKRINFTSGDTNFPGKSTTAESQTCAKSIVKGVADALIAMNIGWAVDTDYNSSTDDFSDVPDANNSGPWPGLFLINSTSGCKLLVCYNGGAYSFPNLSGNDIVHNGNEYYYLSGLIMSIIPSGSLSSVGSTFDSSFLPSDATRIIGTSTTQYNIVYRQNSGDHYSYGIYATDSCVGVVVGRSNIQNLPNLKTPNYFVGKIIGDLFNTSDNSNNAMYGSFLCGNVPGSSMYETCSGFPSQTQYNTSDYFYVMGYRGGSLTHGSYSAGSIAKSDGTWANGYYYNHACTYIWPSNNPEIILSPYSYNSSNTGKSVWIPFQIFVSTNDFSTYGITADCGLKGNLDSSLFRCAIGTYGQQFDNGNFICCNDYNFLIGWDPNNDSLAGT